MRHARSKDGDHNIAGGLGRAYAWPRVDDQRRLDASTPSSARRAVSCKQRSTARVAPIMPCAVAVAARDARRPKLSTTGTRSARAGGPAPPPPGGGGGGAGGGGGGGARDDPPCARGACEVGTLGAGRRRHCPSRRHRVRARKEHRAPAHSPRAADDAGRSIRRDKFLARHATVEQAALLTRPRCVKNDEKALFALVIRTRKVSRHKKERKRLSLKQVTPIYSTEMLTEYRGFSDTPYVPKYSFI
jgi:hypothetical protein